MFFIGSDDVEGIVSRPVAGRAGGRRITPWTTGMVRVLRALNDGAFSAGGGRGCDAGRGTCSSGGGLEGAGDGGGSPAFATSGVGEGRGGGTSGSGRFLALKKISGQGMVQKQSRNFNGLNEVDRVRERSLSFPDPLAAKWKADCSVNLSRKQEALFVEAWANWPSGVTQFRGI
jgi:hypothetical protein